MVEGSKQIISKLTRTSRFSRGMLALALADVALISYISFGYFVPTRIDLPYPKVLQGRISPGDTAKPSPLVLAMPARKQTARAEIPVIDATSGANSTGDAFVNTSALVERPIMTPTTTWSALPGAVQTGVQFADQRRAVGRGPVNRQEWIQSEPPAGARRVEASKRTTT